MKLFQIGLLLVVLLVASCETDNCSTTVCGEYGSCNDGVCVCDTGYEQDSTNECSVLSRNKFLGNYTVLEVCNSGNTDNYSCTISTAINGKEYISISNFYDYTNNLVKATVDKSSVTIPYQTTPENMTVSGSGTISGNTLLIDFVINNSGSIDTCSLTMTRQ